MSSESNPKAVLLKLLELMKQKLIHHMSCLILCLQVIKYMFGSSNLVSMSSFCTCISISLRANNKFHTILSQTCRYTRNASRWPTGVYRSSKLGYIY